MSTFGLFVIAIGVSMDAFAVAICQGLSMRKTDYRKALTIALFFGGFQAMMPTIGYFLGSQFDQYIVSIDHWVAFVLLGYLGIGMLREVGDACPVPDPHLRLSKLLILSVATSIDALAVGISFAFLHINIIEAVIFIGLITFATSFVGVALGNKFGEKLHSRANLVGGLILVGMGTKILLSHLGIIA